MAFDAGEARAVYRLSTDEFDRSIARIKARYAELAQQQQQASARIPAPAAVPDTAGITAAQARASRAASQLATEQGRAAVQAQRLATEEQRTATAAAQASAAQVRAEQTALRLAAAQKRAAEQAAKTAVGLGKVGGLPILPRTVERFGTEAIDQFRSGLLGLVGPAAIAGAAVAGVGVAFSKGIEAGGAALRLDRVERTTRAIANTTTAYNAVVAEARRQQSLFGGTLAENLEQLSGFAVQARLSGAEIGKLTNIAQRLAVLDPAQGIAGASIALREALSGDPVSLARRFEIPRAALKGLRDESATTADRLKIIDDFLTKAGISADITSKTTSETAQAYNRLGAAADEAKTRVGGLLAELGKKPADFLANTIERLIQSTPGNIARNLEQTRTNVVATSQSYDDYVTKLRFVNEQLQGVAAPIVGISQAQFDYAKSLQASGTGAVEAAQKAERYATVVEAARQASADWTGQNTALRDRLVELADTSGGNAAAVQNISAAYQAGNISQERFLAALALLEEQQRRATAATQEEEREQRRLSGALFENITAAQQVEEAWRKFTLGIDDNIAKSATAAAQSEVLRVRQEELARDSALAAQGMLGAGDQAVVLAGKYTIAEGAARALISAQQQLTNAEALSDQRAGERSGGRVKNFKEDLFFANRERALVRRQEQDAAGQLQAEIRLAGAKGDTRREIELLRQSQRGLARDSAEFKNIEAEIISIQKQADKRAGATGRKADAAAQKEANALFRADLDAAASAQERIAVLEEKRRGLEAKGLQNSAAYRQVLADITDEQAKLADEQERANRAAVDARLGAVRDAQERIKEQRERAGLERQLQSSRFSAAQQEVARLRLQEIDLEQQKRALDIQRDARTAGLNVPTAGAAAQQIGAAIPVGAQAPVFAQPAVAALPPVQPPQINLTLNVEIDAGTGRATVVNPPAGVALDVLVRQGLSRVVGG